MKNPLYVVTNGGKDVEEVGNLFEALVKKLCLESVVAFFNSILEEILKSVNSYAMLIAIQEFIDNIVAQLKELGAKVPFLSRFV